jgi:hypothetical protein
MFRGVVDIVDNPVMSLGAKGRDQLRCEARCGAPYLPILENGAAGGTRTRNPSRKAIPDRLRLPVSPRQHHGVWGGSSDSSL